MNELPPRPHLGHLKKQAKELLNACRQHDGVALARLRAGLPAAAGHDDAAIIAMDLRLHDAQSCLAREYGFPSWRQLKDYVESLGAAGIEAESLRRRWVLWAFGAGYQAAKPELAARLLDEHPQLQEGHIELKCAIGDAASVRKMIANNPQWARQQSSPEAMSPLLNVCCSSLIRLPAFAQGLRDCAKLLLAAGADPHDAMYDPAFPDEPLSALYAAAGRHHDPVLTRLLLAAGANPNDGESLYHAVEAADSECTRLLLEAGAGVTGTNALFRALDFERPHTVRLLLTHGADANEQGPPGSALTCPLIHAIRRRRSPTVIRMLLDAGAEVSACNGQGISAFRLARRLGLDEVAALLQGVGDNIETDELEMFVAACARADRDAVFAMLAHRPQLLLELSEGQLQLLPELAGAGCDDAVRLMVEAGWPISVRGGDIDGSALNHAVFRGDSALTTFLLAHGARYDERHRYNDNVFGTLHFASRAETMAHGDWLGCAKALIDSGAPVPDADYEFSDDVAEYFAELRSE